MSHDEKLIQDHCERLATLETMPDEIRRLRESVDEMKAILIAIKTERNFVVSIAVLIAGFLGGLVTKFFN